MLSDEQQQGKNLSYTYQERNKQLVYYNLKNGMKLVLVVPDKEIYAGANRLVGIVLTTIAIALVFSGIVGIIIGSNISRPIKQLTAVIGQTAKLDFRATEFGARLRKHKDEIGVMANEIHSMRKVLREMMGNLDQAGQTILDNVNNLNEIMDKNRSDAQENSAATQEIAAGIQEANANTRQSCRNIRRQ